MFHFLRRLYSPWNSLGQSTGGGISRGSSKPRSSALQVDSLPAKPQGKPKNTGVGSLSLLQGIFLTQESNQGFLHYRQILYQLSFHRSPWNQHNSNTIQVQYSLYSTVSAISTVPGSGISKDKNVVSQARLCVSLTSIPVDHGKSKRVSEKHLFLLYWLCQCLWLYGSQ